MQNKQEQQYRSQRDREFETKILDVARVTRVVAGGRRFRFRTTVILGDKKGKIGLSVGKGPDVSTAMNKATEKAKKNLVRVPLVNGTIPNEVQVKYKSAKIIIKPRKEKLIAGGILRTMAHLSGIKTMTAKIIGSQSKLNNAKAMMIALQKLYAITPAKTLPRRQAGKTKK